MNASIRRLRACLLLLAVLWLAGCAGLPKIDREPSLTLAAPAGSALTQLASMSGVPAGRSGFWPMPHANFALDARLALIRNASTSIDLQYYLIGNDAVGHLILRELRDAAARGVRVRLLLDDLYTQGMDALLVGLQAHPNIEIRLFNPFVSGRDWTLGRWVAFAADFRRLNRRMHNKLFIADAALAVVGGRNLADEYFFRSRDANFLDMDVLIGGALVPRLGVEFDRYWNSEQAYPLRAITTSVRPARELAGDFDRLSAGRDGDAAAVPSGTDFHGQPPLSTLIGQQRLPQWVVADAVVHADAPAKARPGAPPLEVGDTVTRRTVQLLKSARQEVMIFSPYFIPGEQGLEHLRLAREAGIQVRIVTNAMSTSDEPLVNLAYRGYRNQMLAMGIDIYELSAERLTRDPELRVALGSSRGRLHAKMAFIDRQTVLIGSMNMDPRSAHTNTELGIAVRSPELASMILGTFRADRMQFAGVYQVQFKPDGTGVQWVGRDADGEQVMSDEPGVGPWQRLKLWLMSLFVPEDLL